MAFTFLPEDNLSLDIPDFQYLAVTPTDFEVCREKGIKRGAMVRLKNLLEGSPQGIGSLWVITSYRPDIDRVVVQPVDAKAGCFAQRSITINCLKKDFDRLTDFKQQDCAANA